MLPILLSVVLGVAVLQQPPGRMPHRVPPVDEAVKDPTFLQFREDLLTAVRRRDIKAVFAYISADVVATLDKQKGHKALMRAWRIDKSPMPFLTELERVLTLGGRLSACQFVAPYPYTETENTLDMVDYIFVTVESAPVHAKPDVRTPTLLSASSDVFRYDSLPEGWVKVQLHDGRTGYMQERFVRSPADTHAVFARILNEWKLVSFYGGLDV